MLHLQFPAREFWGEIGTKLNRPPGHANTGFQHNSSRFNRTLLIEIVYSLSAGQLAKGCKPAMFALRLAGGSRDAWATSCPPYRTAHLDDRIPLRVESASSRTA